MGQHVGGSSGSSASFKPRNEKLNHKLVIEDIEIVERKKIVDVPELRYVPKNVEYERPVIKDVETIRYRLKEEKTTKYVVEEKRTVKYIPKEVECEKPVVVLKTYERPILEEVKYEKPVLHEHVYEVANVKDIDMVKELIGMVRELRSELSTLKTELDKLRNYKLIEEVVKVPKIQWHTERVERIEWVNVKRERPNAY